MTHRVFIFPKLRTAKDVLRSTAKRPPFTRPFEKWHGKRSQTPLKSAWQHLHQIYWSLWIKLSWKESLLVIQKSLDCLLTHCLPIRSTLFLIGARQRNQFRCKYLKNKRNFQYISLFFLLFLWVWKSCS